MVKARRDYLIRFPDVVIWILRVVLGPVIKYNCKGGPEGI